MRATCVTVVTSLVLTLSSGRTLAQDARPDGKTVAARSGNVLFRMPKDWTRKDNDGVTVLKSPQLAGGKWVELRLAPGEESQESPEQAVARHIATIRERYQVLQATPVKSSRHPRGWSAAAVALTASAAQAGAAKPDLRFWMIYAARPDNRTEVLYYVSNDYALFSQQSQTVEQFISDLNYTNLIVLAPGTPPLTEFLANETTDFLEWLLDVPLADEQRRAIRDGLVEVWKQKVQKEIDATLQIVNLRRQLAAIEPAKAEFARAALQGNMVAGLRKDPSPVAQLLVQVYDAGHKSIADGPPPLTRQSADAMLDLIYFMASAVEGGQTVAPTKEEKQQWATKLAEQYPKLPEPQRHSLAQMPLVWAALSWAWPTLSEAERAKLKEQFAQFEPVTQVRNLIAAARLPRDESFAATIQRMQRSNASFRILSNVTMQIHDMNAAIISNIGGGGYRYEYRYRYR